MKPPALKPKTVADLTKARKHLEYSYAKVIKLKFDHEFTEEELETLESFSSRFARYSDLIVSRYFRLLILEKDPAFRGSLIDLLNVAEKLSWIESKDRWMRIRELRNVAAHEYTAEDYKKLYQELIQLTPTLFAVSTEL